MTGRCLSCDNKMSEQEMRRKIKSNLTKKIEYSELCSSCLRGSDIIFQQDYYVDTDVELNEE